MGDIANKMEVLTNDLRQMFEDSDHEEIRALIPHMQALKIEIHLLSSRDCWERCNGDGECLRRCISQVDL